MGQRLANVLRVMLYYFKYMINLGAGSGTGANINIAWSLSEQPLSDAEYLAALRTIVLPVIKVSI